MPDLPTGTITFLFTDIEGSTKLWERCPEDMQSALARHDFLLRNAIERHSGYVFKTVGDAFCGAFQTATDALNAVLESQLALSSEEWGETGTIRVRMGLHTGEAEERDNDYFGQTLNRVARLQSIVYGGQVLISQSTYELLRDRLPERVELRPLGTHRLKDLNRAENIYQVLYPGLPSDFPSLRSLDTYPNNLKVQLTSFIGREKEMGEISGLLDSHALVTLLGPGGTGKTRLSLQVGADRLEQYPDGVWLIELAPISDPALIAQTIASVIGVREETGKTLTQTLSEHLKSRTVLLILDNCEHLISDCASLVNSLMLACPHLHILASSREGFNIPGETIYRVPTLRKPDPKSKQTVESLSQFDSVRLFIDRAISMQSTFTVTNQNVPALSQLCSRLDGIPLAIELAAARVRSLSVEEINSKLESSFRLLTGGSRTALPRQQTLKALIDWSYDMLSELEMRLFGRLSVFGGGWTQEAAESVCADEELEDWEIFDLLMSLVDKSLVIAEQEEGSTRYRLLETIKQYAQDRLKETDEGEGANKRHLSYYMRFAEENSMLLSGAQQQACLDTIDTEYDNIRIALDWAMLNDRAAALKLATVMGQFWYLSGLLTEGRERLELALASQADSEQTELHTEAAYHIGRIAIEQGDFKAAKSHMTRCLDLYREQGNREKTASVLNSLGIIALQHNDYTAARSLLEESLTLQRELGKKQGIVAALSNLGNLMQDIGDYQAALALYEEGLTIANSVGDRRIIANLFINIGNAMYQQGDSVKARQNIEVSMEIARELNDDWYMAYSLCGLAAIAKDEGNFVEARSMTEDALDMVRKVDDKCEIAYALSLLGELDCLEGGYSKARSLFIESLDLRRELGQNKECIISLESFAALQIAKMQHSVHPETARNLAVSAATLLAAAEEQRRVFTTPRSPRGIIENEKWMAIIDSAVNADDLTAARAAGRDLSFEEAMAYSVEGNI